MLPGIARALGRKLLVPQFCCAQHPFKELFADSVLHHCSMSSLLQPEALTGAGFTVYPGLPLSLDKTFKKKAVRVVNVADDLELIDGKLNDQQLKAQLEKLGTLLAARATQWPRSFRKCVSNVSNVSNYSRSRCAVLVTVSVQGCASLQVSA